MSSSARREVYGEVAALDKGLTDSGQDGVDELTRSLGLRLLEGVDYEGNGCNVSGFALSSELQAPSRQQSARMTLGCFRLLSHAMASPFKCRSPLRS